MAKTTIRVLKHFHLSMLPKTAAQPGAVPQLPIERVFAPGDHEVDEDVANHPYIKALADGKIESPAAAKARVEKEAADAEKAEADAAAGKAQAEAALARFTKKAAESSEAGADAIEKELNTPVGQLRRSAGGAK